VAKRRVEGELVDFEALSGTYSHHPNNPKSSVKLWGRRKGVDKRGWENAKVRNLNKTGSSIQEGQFFRKANGEQGYECKKGEKFKKKEGVVCRREGATRLDHMYKNEGQKGHLGLGAPACTGTLGVTEPAEERGDLSKAREEDKQNDNVLVLGRGPGSTARGKNSREKRNCGIGTVGFEGKKKQINAQKMKKGRISAHPVSLENRIGM